MVFAGLPEPAVNRKLLGVDGEVRRRFDLSYPSVKVIVEYDGRQHVERVQQGESDLDRREEFDDDGWRILTDSPGPNARTCRLRAPPDARTGATTLHLPGSGPQATEYDASSPASASSTRALIRVPSPVCSRESTSPESCTRETRSPRA